MIRLFNGENYGVDEINTLANSDEFYYGHLAKHALSSSMLRNILNSPNTQLKYMEDDAKGKGKDSEALILGKLTHWLYLEPNVFYGKHYVEAERINAKEYKEAVSKYGNDNVFKAKHRNIAEWLCEKLDNNEELREIRKNSEVEVPSVGMIDDVPVRSKADMVCGDIIYDLKTGITSPEDFEWKVRNMHYDLQAWIYLQLFPQAKEFKFIYINKITRDIGLIDVPEEVIERGGTKYRLAADAYFKIVHNCTLDEIKYKLDQHIYRGTAK